MNMRKLSYALEKEKRYIISEKSYIIPTYLWIVGD
jgi:hypothetical protein